MHQTELNCHLAEGKDCLCRIALNEEEKAETSRTISGFIFWGAVYGVIAILASAGLTAYTFFTHGTFTAFPYLIIVVCWLLTSGLTEMSTTETTNAFDRKLEQKQLNCSLQNEIRSLDKDLHSARYEIDLMKSRIERLEGRGNEARNLKEPGFMHLIP